VDPFVRLSLTFRDSGAVEQISLRKIHCESGLVQDDYNALHSLSRKVILLANPKSGEKRLENSHFLGAQWGLFMASSVCDKRLIPTPMGFASRIKSVPEPFYQSINSGR
jgi:hypothetical protein